MVGLRQGWWARDDAEPGKEELRALDWVGPDRYEAAAPRRQESDQNRVVTKITDVDRTTAAMAVCVLRR